MKLASHKMDVSSQEVIDDVAEKLKYYMEVKRREDGFDLSGPNEPRRAYPHLRTGSSLSYGKIHDRSLKHYFTPSMIKTQIANLEAVPPGSPRQRTVTKRLKRQMKSYSHKEFSSDQLLTRRQIDDGLYSAQLEALKMLHTETQQRLKRKIHNGSNTVLRRAVAPTMTHREAIRLVNRSSQILVATETVALAHDIISQRHGFDSRPQSAPAARSHGLPGLYDNRVRPKTARGRPNNGRSVSSTERSYKRRPKYVWDMNGRKVLYSEHDDDMENEHSSSYSSSSISVHLDTGRELHGSHHRQMRPASAMGLPHNAHVSPPTRPYSASVARQRETLQQRELATRKALSPDSGFSVDAETQTRHHRRPPDRVRRAFVPSSVTSSDNNMATPVQLCKYVIEIQTGDRLGAGTTADIYLSLHGDDGDTDEIYLTNPISNGKKRKPFKRGQLDIFEIEAENVGKLNKIGIGHDQKEKGFSWFVDYVKVQYGGQDCNFQCRTWFSGIFSQRKTFKYILLDHDPSETSSSEPSSESSSGTSEEELGKQRRKKKFYRRKTSSSSEMSRFSKRTKSSRKSTTEEHEEKTDDSHPTFQLIVSPADKTDGSSRESVASIPAERNKSSVEYSSDSSEDANRKGKDTESLVEESEDTEKVKSSSTSSEDTLTDASHHDEDDKSVTASTFFGENFSRFSLKQSSDSDSSTSTTEKSFRIEGKDTKSKSLFPSFSSSNSGSSSSSSDNEPPSVLAQSVNFKRRPSIAESVPINLESATPVASSSIADATSLEVKELTMLEAQETTHELLSQPVTPLSTSSSSSSSSGSDSNEDARSTDSTSDVTEVSSLGRPQPRRKMSLAETIPFNIEITKVLPTSPLQTANTEVVTNAAGDGEIEVKRQEVFVMPQAERMDRKSSSSSNASDAGVTSAEVYTSDAVEKEGNNVVMSAEEKPTVQPVTATMEFNAAVLLGANESSRRKSSSSSSSSSESEDENDQKLKSELLQQKTNEEEAEEKAELFMEGFNAAVLLGANESSRRKSSSSSSSSSKSEDENDQKLKSELLQQKTNEEEAEEKAELFMEGFNAGIAASRNISVTSPSLLTNEMKKKQEIDESLQSDEEGIVQSPRQPAVRGDIHNLIKEGDLPKVMEIVALRPELKEQSNEKGWAPIHVAATSGKLEILQWLAAMGVNLKAETATGYTAMHMAAMHGHVKCVMVLHAMGGDIDATNVDDQTPLHLACMSGHLETAKWLVANRASLNARDTFYRTALDLADQYQHNEVSQFLTTCMDDLNNDNSTMALLQTSKTSMESSQHQPSSEDETPSPEKWHDDPEEQDKDTIAEMESHEALEEKRRMYDKQQRKMERRRSSFLDTIRAETEELFEKGSSSSDSDSSSSSSSDNSD